MRLNCACSNYDFLRIILKNNEVEVTEKSWMVKNGFVRLKEAPETLSNVNSLSFVSFCPNFAWAAAHSTQRLACFFFFLSTFCPFLVNHVDPHVLNRRIWRRTFFYVSFLFFLALTRFVSGSSSDCVGESFRTPKCMRKIRNDHNPPAVRPEAPSWSIKR